MGGEDLKAASFLLKEGENSWQKLSIGQEATFKSVWPKFDIGYVILHESELLTSGEYKGVEISAEELHKQFAGDPEKCEKDNDGKTLVVTGIAGEVVTVLSEDYFQLKIGEQVILCDFEYGDGDAYKKLKPGVKVKLMTTGITTTNKQLVLMSAFLLPGE